MKIIPKGLVWLVVAVGASLSGCFGFPAIQVKDNTYGETQIGKQAYALPSFETDFVARSMGSWFNEQCPVGLGSTRSICAQQLGMTCQDGVALDCRYTAQETVRRTDRGALPEMKEWRTNVITIFVAAPVGEEAKVRSEVSSLKP